MRETDRQTDVANNRPHSYAVLSNAAADVTNGGGQRGGGSCPHAQQARGANSLTKNIL